MFTPLRFPPFPKTLDRHKQLGDSISRHAVRTFGSLMWEPRRWLFSGSRAMVLRRTSPSGRLQLRFAPATTLGSGDPIDSWQQIALTWATRASEPIAAAPANVTANITANAKQDDSRRHADNVTVHVCVDEAGKLLQDPTIVHSSGSASLDQAAVRIAASGSAYYRPDTSPNGPPASGCAQLTIKFDTK